MSLPLQVKKKKICSNGWHLLDGVIAVVGNDGFFDVVNLERLCLLKEVLEDRVKLLGVPNLVTQYVCQFMNRNIDQHILIIIGLVFISQAQVDFLLVDGITLLALIERQGGYLGMQRGQRRLQVLEHGIQLAVILRNTIKDDVTQEAKRDNDKDTDENPGSNRRRRR